MDLAAFTRSWHRSRWTQWTRQPVTSFTGYELKNVVQSKMLTSEEYILLSCYSELHTVVSCLESLMSDFFCFNAVRWLPFWGPANLTDPFRHPCSDSCVVNNGSSTLAFQQKWVKKVTHITHHQGSSVCSSKTLSNFLEPPGWSLGWCCNLSTFFKFQSFCTNPPPCSMPLQFFELHSRIPGDGFS